MSAVGIRRDGEQVDLGEIPVAVARVQTPTTVYDSVLLIHGEGCKLFPLTLMEIVYVEQGIAEEVMGKALHQMMRNRCRCSCAAGAPSF